MASTYDKTFVSESKTPQPKRIVICCDGTWQSAISLDPKQGCPSNVARLSRVLAKAGTDKDTKEWQQIVYYDAGVGTGEITDYEKKRQGSQGIGLLENVLEAYNFIVNNYSHGDELFFFGFSRGAYTVRSAAGLVSQLGVLKPASMRSFLKLFSEYIKFKDFTKQFIDSRHGQEFARENPDYFITQNTVIQIKVIGVWDTVGALGVPDVGHFYRWDNSSHRKAYRFHDTELNERILHAYQAVALDECRSPFSPSVWKIKTDNKITKLCQCWFPGVHINVGGGSPANADEKDPKGDREQLASISYAWMLDRIRPHLALDETALQAQKSDMLEAAKPRSTGKPEPQGWFWNSVNYFKDTVAGSRVAHQAGYALGLIEDSHSWEYDLMGFPEVRTPNRYHDWKAGEYTVERIHPSVYFRQEYQRELQKTHKNLKIYEPAALKGWVRVYEKHGMGIGMKERKGWTWIKYKADNKGNRLLDGKGEPIVENSLWEFEIGNMPADKSVERWLIDNSWVESIHKEVQMGWRGSESK
ncbi:hypothetical protein AOQ84DRAFT_384127 [Glonium stellatum]|uniref:T6SS Phospholipase effector Tle1-like catalytic domain-containing protein n=1 Tax=Glonium stellatum TaxID=574774 RepID=A0A8E2FF56_9PEZI|nr:hypothetical protein AOQ84DRAFT_384127 [Glonium stellatum]